MPTLTTAEIVADLFSAFKKQIPALSYFSTDFSGARAKYNQQIIAHVASLPTAADHNASNGYFDSMTSGRTLLTDVPVTIDTWKDVAVKFPAADLNQDRSTKYLETVNAAAYVLGKAMVDSVLAKVVAANISYTEVCTIANATYAKLRGFSVAMNANGAGPQRFGLVTPGFMSGLLADSIIASGDYFNRRQEAEIYAELSGIAGFQRIAEYPDFPANSQSLTGFFFDRRAVVIALRLPEDAIELAASRGVPIPMKTEVQTDPESGLSVLALERLNTTTLDLELTFSVMFGSAVGKQGGSAGTIMDKAGYRVTTA